jgi:hypothetical protein
VLSSKFTLTRGHATAHERGLQRRSTRPFQSPICCRRCRETLLHGQRHNIRQKALWAYTPPVEHAKSSSRGRLLPSCKLACIAEAAREVPALGRPGLFNCRMCTCACTRCTESLVQGHDAICVGDRKPRWMHLVFTASAGACVRGGVLPRAGASRGAASQVYTQATVNETL